MHIDNTSAEDQFPDNDLYMNVSHNRDHSHNLGMRARQASVSAGGPAALWCPNTGKKQFDPANATLPEEDATPEDYDNEDVYLKFEEIYHSVSGLGAGRISGMAVCNVCLCCLLFHQDVTSHGILSGFEKRHDVVTLLNQIGEGEFGQ